MKHVLRGFLQQQDSSMWRKNVNRSSSPVVPVVCLILAMIIWASSFIALKVAFQTYDSMVVIFGRMFIASICFMFFLPNFRKTYFQWKDLKYILLMAFFEPCLYFIFEAKALENTTASQAGMITAMLPLMVAVGASIILKERVSVKTIIGLMLAIAGACLLSLFASPSAYAPNPSLGNFLEFLAMACAAGYTITLKQLTARYHPFFLAAMQAFVGSLFYFPFLFFVSTPMPAHFEPVGTISIIYLGVVVTLGAYGCYNYGVSRIPASQASAYINMIPVFTIILARIILGEKFTPGQYLASVLVFIGIFVSHERRPQKIEYISQENVKSGTRT